MSIPPWLVSAISSLPDETQQQLLKYGARAMMDPWFVSFAGIPLACLLAYIPVGIRVTIAIAIQWFNYNNKTPRETDYVKALNSPTLGRFANRCTYAHLNGLEAFSPFAIAVLLAKIQKVKGSLVRPLVIRFLQLRFIYNFLYIFGFNDLISYARTTVWFISAGTIMEIYGLALSEGMAA
jgi:uncharacterized MAPEG superfamily protein